MIYWMLGLGNPGAEYRRTRHNAGRIVLEAWRRRRHWPAWRPDAKLKALISSGRLGKHRINLVLPETMMNRSGGSVRALIKNAAARRRLVVVHDDLDLPLGQVKISFNRSAGGHRGVASIITALGSQEFIRLRLGVAGAKKPAGEAAVVKFILGTFREPEEKIFKKTAARAGEALAVMVDYGLEAAMADFNRK